MHDDELIDRAAQAMTSGEPSPRLRGAVHARIAAGSAGVRRPGLAKQARHAMARHLWIPALVGAAIVMLAITVPRTLMEPQGELLRSTRFAGVLSVTPPVTLEPAAVSLHQVEPPERARPDRTRPRNLVVNPLVIDPISVPLMAVDSSSGVMPLEIEPLQIEPLQPQ